eukprot:gnl/MRDRNA2_/MRDRNA2_152816_c0_seq1.p1 gnl/MRDRNA2_/MRDRNA2_152816_c0~~gnl/MRDRNA2_/MRDRNA2_152816_c0_seq1.p1  ORF type:complete len:299 (+),score=62.08 gnl/MRDRNA2_/MRDRNA2_152816_c0_seq1:51-899(+)
MSEPLAWNGLDFESRAKQLAERFSSPAEAAEYLMKHGPTIDAQLLACGCYVKGTVDSYNASQVAKQVVARGWAALGHCGLQDEVLQGALVEACTLDSQMTPGLISNASSTRLQDSSRRSDRALWLVDGPCEKRAGVVRCCIDEWPSLKNLQQSLRALGRAILPELGLRPKGHTDTMLACYDGNGASYTPHVDGDVVDGRKLTLVLYLNQDWTESDGGCLHIMDPEGFEWQRVKPLLGSLVAFRADEVLHEVKPSWAKRYALTVWFFAEDAKLRQPLDWEICD